MDNDCSRTSAGAVAGLPDDLLLEILSRVPAKSVCRFRCVSKAWHDLIADPDHRKDLRHAMEGIIIMTPAPKTNHFSFGIMDLKAAGSVPQDVADDLGFSYLTELHGMHNLILLGSCNGLILFGHQKVPPYYVELGDIVCNPTTKQWAWVPLFVSPDQFNRTFLTFDPAVSSHFHLIHFQISMEDQGSLQALHAYSSETGTWSHNQIDSQEEQARLVAGWHRHVSLTYEVPCCAFVNGFLYLIVWDLDRERIVVLDVQGKARRMIELPSMVDGGHCSYYLEQSQGSLHCMTKGIGAPEEKYNLSIWVLQDFDTQEWVFKNTVSSLKLLGELPAHNVDFNFSVVDNLTFIKIAIWFLFFIMAAVH